MARTRDKLAFLQPAVWELCALRCSALGLSAARETLASACPDVMPAVLQPRSGILRSDCRSAQKATSCNDYFHLHHHHHLECPMRSLQDLLNSLPQAAQPKAPRHAGRSHKEQAMVAIPKIKVPFLHSKLTGCCTTQGSLERTFILVYATGNPNCTSGFSTNEPA